MMFSVLQGIIVSAEAMYFSDRRVCTAASASPTAEFVSGKFSGAVFFLCQKVSNERRKMNTVTVPKYWERMENQLYVFAHLMCWAK